MTRALEDASEEITAANYELRRDFEMLARNAESAPRNTPDQL